MPKTPKKPASPLVKRSQVAAKTTIKVAKVTKAPVIEKEKIAPPIKPTDVLFAISFDTSFSTSQVLVIEAIDSLTALKQFQHIISSNQYIKITLANKAKTEAICLSSKITNIKVAPFTIK